MAKRRPRSKHGRAMVGVGISIAADQREALARLAARADTSVSEIVCRAIDAYLAALRTPPSAGGDA